MISKKNEKVLKRKPSYASKRKRKQLIKRKTTCF